MLFPVGQSSIGQLFIADFNRSIANPIPIALDRRRLPESLPLAQRQPVRV
jgi:hypothetical protein